MGGLGAAASHAREHGPALIRYPDADAITGGVPPRLRLQREIEAVTPALQGRLLSRCGRSRTPVHHTNAPLSNAPLHDARLIPSDEAFSCAPRGHSPLRRTSATMTSRLARHLGI